MTPHTLKHLAVAIGLSGVLLLSGCHKKVAAPPPPPPPPPPAKAAAPTATIKVSPDVILQGQSATLSWSTTDATEATIGDLGTVAASGSQDVSPASSTTYTLTAKGPGGSVQASTRITVNQPPPPPPAPPALTDEELFAKYIQDAYFDFDKSNLRPDASAAVSQDAEFLKQHTNMKILIEGHCDDRGSEEYNIALGESRAEAMKNALTLAGVDGSRIRVVSLGKEKPFCTDDNENCWQQNRRDHVVLDR